MAERTEVQVAAHPRRELAAFVAPYAGFEIRGFPAGVHLGTPTGALTVVLSLSDPLAVTGPGGARGRERTFDAVATGVHSRSVAVRHDGNQHGIRLAFTPLGARAILGVPLAALAEEVVRLDEVDVRLGRILVDRLRDATTWPERFAILDTELARAARQRLAPDGPRIRPEVEEAWRRLVAERGWVRIGPLAADLGWSRRHLGERFRQEIGVSPKDVAGVLRFAHAHELATVERPPSWAAVAAAAGYADQAHLVRDWRAVTGQAPTSWRDGEVLPP